jgi:TolB-like protein
MSGDPEQEYFTDGLVEDLITNLSKNPGLFVIARNSTYVYKGKAADVRQVAKDLGVRYLLEGSVRRSANRLRITGQLIEGASGSHVWADKFDGALEDVFDLQDRFTESIVGAIEPSLRRAEIERARRKRPGSLDAYDLYLQALLLGESLKLDPGLAAAHAYKAWSPEQRFPRGGFNPLDRAAALEHAQTTLKVGVDDAQALSIAAFVHANIAHDYESAIHVLDRALVMNGNSALALGFSALVHACSERYQRAEEHALRALRLSPFDPLNYHPYLALAFACLFNGRPQEAAKYSTLAVEANPGFSVVHASLAASLANLGQTDDARAAGLRLLKIDPGFTVSGFVRMGIFRKPLMESMAAMMRKAGLPN